MPEISLAPMMKYTTPQFRMLVRKISRTAVLFTEMIVSSTVIHVTQEKLRFMLGDPEDLTVVQLGGSDPSELSQTVKILKELGWKHFNLNCGCPSERVQNGKFGALLMLEKENVADIINRVYDENGIVISLKIRIGVDEHDSFEFFRDFVHFISTNSPCNKFYVHARKCWLCGLNPKQNRNVPALNYQFVYDLKSLYPHLFISLNGGLKDNFIDHIKNLNGVMIGRHAVDDICIFAKYENSTIDLKVVIKEYLEEGSKLNPPKTKLLMPLINLRKGKTHSTVLKQTINQIIQQNIPYNQIFQIIEPFICD
jgi:tRNA-dihydrouridine synthase A